MNEHPNHPGGPEPWCEQCCADSTITAPLTREGRGGTLRIAPEEIAERRQPPTIPTTPFVVPPLCRCGLKLDLCDCGELVCRAYGHARHVCDQGGTDAAKY